MRKSENGSILAALTASEAQNPSVLTRHRDDIQGLRGVAVLLVVLGHAGIRFLAGGYIGVDVFFVLSGFLITGILLASAAKHGRISMTAFYARRARRILPAAALTLVVTDIVAYRLLNFVRARETMWDSIWAAAFGANIHFARESTDYFARAQPPSALQHVWSLSVEEQFYLVWPGLLAISLFGFAVLLHRRRQSEGGVTDVGMGRLLAVIGVATAASLAYSIYDTDASRTSAYFSTLARVWELGLGAALAIAATSVARVPAALRAVGGWAGLVAIALAAVLFSERTAFPGYAALLPTVGAALLIGAGIGDSASRFGPGRLLAVGPLRYVGDRSYAFYLWHWPVLILAAEYAGHNLSVVTNLLLLAGAFAISIVSYRLVENPIRRARWSNRQSAVLWPASIGAVVLVAGLTFNFINGTASRLDAAAAAARPVRLADPKPLASFQPARGTREAKGPEGGLVLPAVVAAVKAARSSAPIPAPLVPSPSSLLHDVYLFPSGCAPNDPDTSAKICRLGAPSSKTTVVIVGDSHAQMWMPTLLALAPKKRWAVIPLAKSGCNPSRWIKSSPGSATVPTDAQCQAWYRWMQTQVKALHPSVTLVTGAYGGSLGARADAVVNAITSFTTAAKRSSKNVVVIGDTPRLLRQPVDCLLASGSTMKTCTTPWNDTNLSIVHALAALARIHGAGFLDTTGWFCFSSLCPTVVGHTIAYIDTGHLSKTYATQLARAFDLGLQQALRP
jgi:peptidoglycan/LPS O-acetylase OafA/YrhL